MRKSDGTPGRRVHNIALGTAYGQMLLGLRMARVARGLRQCDVDERAGWTEGQCHKYERGKRTPSFIDLVSWAQVVGIELLWQAQPEFVDVIRPIKARIASTHPAHDDLAAAPTGG